MKTIYICSFEQLFYRRIAGCPWVWISLCFVNYVFYCRLSDNEINLWDEDLSQSGLIVRKIVISLRDPLVPVLEEVSYEPLTLLLYGFVCQLLTCKPLSVLLKNSSLQLIATANWMQFRNSFVTPFFCHALILEIPPLRSLKQKGFF